MEIIDILLISVEDFLQIVPIPDIIFAPYTAFCAQGIAFLLGWNHWEKSSLQEKYDKQFDT